VHTAGELGVARARDGAVDELRLRRGHQPVRRAGDDQRRDADGLEARQRVVFPGGGELAGEAVQRDAVAQRALVHLPQHRLLALEEALAEDQRHEKTEQHARVDGDVALGHRLHRPEHVGRRGMIAGHLGRPLGRRVAHAPVEPGEGGQKGQ
jgi:hypothetical protein